jgi:hypothetical protein
MTPIRIQRHTNAIILPWFLSKSWGMNSNILHLFSFKKKWLVKKIILLMEQIAAKKTFQEWSQDPCVGLTKQTYVKTLLSKIFKQTILFKTTGRRICKITFGETSYWYSCWSSKKEDFGHCTGTGNFLFPKISTHTFVPILQGHK